MFYCLLVNIVIVFPLMLLAVHGLYFLVIITSHLAICLNSFHEIWGSITMSFMNKMFKSLQKVSHIYLAFLQFFYKTNSHLTHNNCIVGARNKPLLLRANMIFRSFFPQNNRLFWLTFSYYTVVPIHKCLDLKLRIIG